MYCFIERKGALCTIAVLHQKFSCKQEKPMTALLAQKKEKNSVQHGALQLEVTQKGGYSQPMQPGCSPRLDCWKNNINDSMSDVVNYKVYGLGPNLIVHR